jgi:glycosyltransferase involved in cell wall biosynthesis
MATWTEPVANDGPRDAVGGAIWRASAERAQEEPLPSGRVLVTCSAPFGVGGLGRHLEEILAALTRRGEPPLCICKSNLEQGASPGRGRADARGLVTALTPLMRFSPAWRVWRLSLVFDNEAARRLPPADHLIAFNGTALLQFRAAKRAHWESVSLVSATAHLSHLLRRHAQAYRQYPLERSWATRILRRNLSEYAQADRIYVSSSYTRESFIEAGISEDVLSTFPLTPDPRYTPSGAPNATDTFDIVYVGGLTVDKGVPLLIDAVRRLGYPDIRLVLVGGWKTRGMRRFIGEACARDSRISVCASDPLPRLRASRLYVHPAYSDGFSYAAAEALACGLPVVVSEDTGMKELIRPGVDGLIVPTGDLPALTEAIEAAYRGRAFRARLPARLS